MEIDSAKERSTQPFDLQPVLKGELLELRPLRPQDFDDLFAVASDPLIWEQHPHKDRHKEEEFRTFFREALESGGALIATDVRDGRIIGSSRFHGHNRETSEIEIGWTFLARSPLGRPLQRRNEATHASPCVQVRRPGRLSHRPTESSLAASRGENWRCPRRLETRCEWSREPRLPDHSHGRP